MAKECDQPRNPDTVTCRNCDEQGHFSKDCPKPRDYSKVQCKNCQQFGHTIKVCACGDYCTVLTDSNSAARSLLLRVMPWATAAPLAVRVAGVPAKILPLPLEGSHPGAVVTPVVVDGRCAYRWER